LKFDDVFASNIDNIIQLVLEDTFYLVTLISTWEKKENHPLKPMKHI